ncbi:unnamed protein product [Camellia sinensis]
MGAIKEASVHEIQIAFKQNKLNSRRLVEFYLTQIESLNPVLRSVIEVNPEALFLADKPDRERNARSLLSQSSLLHGIPILLKDNIATEDKLNTTAGSYALLGSVVARDAGVVAKLRKAGAIVLWKASLTDWRSCDNPNVKSADPCGSSTGSAVSVVANMVTLSLGTETAGAILCPSSYNLAVGIKPTIGLTSRGGVVPISPRQYTVGPICRTYIPHGGYVQFLKADGLRGKKLGITSYPYFGFPNTSEISHAFELHFNTLGATLVDSLNIPNFDAIINSMFNDKDIALRSLADAIAFNKKFSDLMKKLAARLVFESGENKWDGLIGKESAVKFNESIQKWTPEVDERK